MAILKSVFLLIIFSNQIFAKDFDDLFKITIEIKNENIENSIDRAFNDLVFRLIGYEDFEKAKMIKLLKKIGKKFKREDKYYNSRRAAFRAAKRNSNIPVSSQPVETITPKSKKWKKSGYSCFGRF